MNFDFIFLGQSVLRYEVPLEVFVGLNELYETKKKHLPNATKQLAGKIPDEVSFMVLGLDPAFIENGEFNKERFDLIALQNGLSPNKLLENFKQELMIRYWNLGIGQSELVSGKRFSRSLNLANQTRDITFTRLDFSKEEDNIKVTKESLEEFYNSNQNKFTSNEKFSISAITKS